MAVIDEKTFGLFDAASGQAIMRLNAATLGVRSFTAVAGSPDGLHVAIGAGRVVLVFERAALEQAGVAIAKDKVAKVTPPSSETDDATRAAFVQQFNKPLLPVQSKLQAELVRLFDRVPKSAVRVHIEADYGPWSEKAGFYWAAQNRKGQTLIAFPIKAGAAELLKAFKGSRPLAKKMAMPLLQRAEREALTAFVGAAWRAAKVAANRPKLGGVLTGSFDFLSAQTMADLDAGAAIDHAKHRWPK